MASPILCSLAPGGATVPKWWPLYPKASEVTAAVSSGSGSVSSLNPNNAIAAPKDILHPLLSGQRQGGLCQVAQLTKGIRFTSRGYHHPCTLCGPGTFLPSPCLHPSSPPTHWHHHHLKKGILENSVVVAPAGLSSQDQHQLTLV